MIYIYIILFTVLVGTVKVCINSKVTKNIVSKYAVFSLSTKVSLKKAEILLMISTYLLSQYAQNLSHWH